MRLVFVSIYMHMHTRIGEIRKKNKFAQQKTVESHNQSRAFRQFRIMGPHLKDEITRCGIGLRNA